MAQLNDLIVTGAARFLNTINGKITNASTADYATSAGSANAVAWGNVSGKPATGIAASNGTNQLTLAPDTKYALGAAGSTFIFTTPSDHQYFAGTGLNAASTSGNNTTFALSTSGAASGSYGMANATTGTNNTNINIPYITVDSYGRVTSISNKTYTSVDNDTKNTAGSTDTSSKIFLIGATSQAANPQTYSQDTAYVGTDGHLYSNSIQVVNLSGSQALTNKTYNGYTLAAACAKAVVTSVDTSASLPTSNAVKTFVENKGYVTTDHQYFAGTALTTNVNGNNTTFNHTTYVTAGTAGTSNATSGSTLAVPYVTYNAQGHITAAGTHTHTISGFLASTTKYAISGSVGGSASSALAAADGCDFDFGEL